MFSKNTSGSILAAVVLWIVLLGISECSAESKLTGKYSYNGDPDCPKMDKVLTAMGVPDGEKKLIRMFAPNATKEISQSGDEITMTYGVPIKQVTNKFTSGKEFDEEVAIGPKIKTTATVEGNKITIKRRLSKDGKEFTEVLECNDEGCISELSIGEDKAQVKWKRMSK